MAKNPLRKRLEEIRDTSDGLRAAVAKSILWNSYGETDDDLTSFLQDLASYGCVSGMVSGLIYYAETESFFDRYYSEVEALRIEFEESVGEPLRIPYQLKNFLAWFGYEETARSLANELRIDL